MLFLRLAPGMIGRGDPASLGAPYQKRIHTLRVSGCEKTCHRAAFGNAENVGAFDADIIHHCPNVISPLLQRRHFHRSIGKARAALVEANKAAELAEALEEKSALRYFPIQIEMRHRARRPHHVERSVASNLISDAHFIAARILCFRQHPAS